MSIQISIVPRPEPESPLPPERPPLWRVKHDRELGSVWRPRLPEVFPFFPNHHVPFTKEWQLFSYEMNQPWLSKDKWSAVYGYKLWITNNQGFGNEEDPRANFVKGTNLEHELPRVEALTCGGNILTGRVSGSNLIVETLNWKLMPLGLQWIREHPWFRTVAVTVDSGGTPRRFPQGQQPDGYMPDVVHPLLADPTRFLITFPLSGLERWTRPFLPDPYTFYLV